MGHKTGPGEGRQERYVQASILMGLLDGPSYGYELISTIQTYGFAPDGVPPGMIYRHLRQMEEDNLVHSQWKTEGAGAAKRIYTLTHEGKEVLELWIQFMDSFAGKLNRFIARYRDKQPDS